MFGNEAHNNNDNMDDLNSRLENMEIDDQSQDQSYFVRNIESILSVHPNSKPLMAPTKITPTKSFTKKYENTGDGFGEKGLFPREGRGYMGWPLIV